MVILEGDRLVFRYARGLAEAFLRVWFRCVFLTANGRSASG